jgi:glycosyltransferase involved in cell wall biosynthesis
MSPLLLDLSHTSHTRARTGIQRVARSLYEALGPRALPITHDPHRHTWRLLQTWEKENLDATAAAGKRSAKWPLAARLRGRLQRATGAAKPIASDLPPASGLLVPEIFSPAVATALRPLLAHVKCRRVALFHDAIALKYPDLSPTKTVARFPAYLVELLAFDGIAAVSDDSRASLIDYWRWLGIRSAPPVVTIPLGIVTQRSASIGENSPASAQPTVLCIGTIEGRKNHLSLLHACETLWARGERFTLHLIGLAQTETGAAALARVRKLQASGRPLRYDGAVSDDALETAYRACTFTVYPSLLEGFGLPVLESVAHGRPCICSARGALGESAREGGCVALERVDALTLADAIGDLLHSPAKVATLSAAARARKLRTWSDYVSRLDAWMHTLAAR